MTKRIRKSIIAATLMIAALGSTSFAAAGSVNGYMESKTCSVSRSYVRARGVIYNSTSTTSGSTSYSKQLR